MTNIIQPILDIHTDQYLLSVTQHDIHDKQESIVNGMDAWAPRGIAGRGVLIDYHSWAQRNGIEYDRLSGHAIPLDAIKKIIREANIQLQAGDIFMIRTGMMLVSLSIRGNPVLMVYNTKQVSSRHIRNLARKKR